MMSSAKVKNSSSSPTSKLRDLSHGTICKSTSILCLVIFFFYAFWFNPSFKLNVPFELKCSAFSSSDHTVNASPTNVGHLMFVVVGSLKSWKIRKGYIEAWWRPNVTRGNLFLDDAPTQEFLPWPPTSPPFQVNEDVTKLRVYHKSVNPIQIRIYRSILETFRLGSNENVRWYVTADDDTLFFVDNLVEVLGKYDHTKYHYIGMNSECIKSNFDFSFNMAFGGGGYAVSYPLIESLVTKLDECINRYPNLHFSDHLSSSCFADLGVDLTQERGFHQIDLLKDISGLLSAHPQSPIISLHHFDAIDPIFPSMNRVESINHLMKAAEVNQSRMLQQAICYHRQSNWSFSVSWGYSTHIYENILPRSVLKKPLETFKPWKNGGPPFYMFNTRQVTNDPCEAPHMFFFNSIDKDVEANQVTTTYTRQSPRNLPPCSSTGNHSADSINKIQVFAPKTHKEAGRIECCDVEYMDTNAVDIRLRACMKDEVIA